MYEIRRMKVAEGDEIDTKTVGCMTNEPTIWKKSGTKLSFLYVHSEPKNKGIYLVMAIPIDARYHNVEKRQSK